MSAQQPYFSTYIQDLEQDPFDAIDFVERLAWRICSGKSHVDADLLKTKFEEEIGSLQLLSEQFQNKISSLEQQQSNQKANFLDTLQRLGDKNGESLDKLKLLESNVQSVSANIIHLGDQLESVHAPRARSYEALQLMKHFDEFLADQPLSSPLFTDPDRLLESAEVIYKLNSIAQELSKEKFGAVQTRIAHKYDEIEQLLIEEFTRSHNRKQMREIATILSEFKGIARCIDVFVGAIQMNSFRSGNVFDDILTLCDKAKPVIVEIFPNTQQVVSKLLLNVFHGRLQETVGAKLQESGSNPELYLKILHDSYTKAIKLQNLLLEKFKGDADPQFLSTLVSSIFGPYLATYPKIEQKFIFDQCNQVLKKFYESKGHQKKNIHFGGLHELKRDIQARLLTVEDFGGETFLSETIAINILQDVKNALGRCTTFCKKPESLELIAALFDMLVKFLYTDHVEYAIELGLAGIPLAEPKTEPPLNFFGIVQQSSAITHLFVKIFDDTVYPIILETQIEDDILRKRDQILRTVEERLNQGLRRQVSAVVGYIKFILTTEQKKSDFRPENEVRELTSMSNACSLVIRYLKNRVTERIQDSVDGGNLQAVLKELGDQFYNTLLNHVLSFNYNSTGAMLLISDISEYKKCVSAWGIAELQKKLDTLHALANLLVVVPENLPDACSSMPLINVNRSFVNSFIQLRHDYKSVRNKIPLFEI